MKKKILLALAAAGLFAWALASVPPSLYRPGEATDTDVFHSGETLLHRIKYRAATDNYHLPLASVSAALLINHSPDGADAVWRKLSGAAAFLLLLALGCELGGPWYGLAGAALLLVVSRFPFAVQFGQSWHGHWGHLQTFFTLLVLAAAGLAVRHRREPTESRAWALALALGAALLYRSTFVFFPPLLALFHWRSLKRKPTRADWKTLAILGLAPYAFLLPWVAMNWTVHHRFILLEDGEANPIIIGGALGAVEKAWSRPPSELGLSDAGTATVLVWAARRVLAHPADYLLGYFRRLSFLLLLNPLLFLFASLSFYFNRRKKEFQVLGLLCAYCVLIHCFMSFLREYFDPLWPLLAAAGAAGLAPFLKKNEPRPRARRASGVVLAGFLSGVLILSLYVYGTLAAYAYGMTHDGAAAEQKRLEEAIARHPGESQLFFERAMRRLETGSVAAAVPDLRTASRLSPENPLMERMLIWSELYLGDASRFTRWSAALPPRNGPDDLLLQAYGRMTLGETRAANRLLAELPETPNRRNRIALPPFVQSMCARVRDYPLLRPTCLEDSLARAEFAEGDRSAALRLLAAAEALNPGFQERRRMVRLYRDLMEYGRAQALLARMIADAPKTASLWVERAELACRAGEPRATLGFLDEARKRNPDAPNRERIAALDRNLKEHARTPEMLALLTRSSPRDWSLWIERAAAAGRAGDLPSTLKFLAEARRLGPDAAGRGRIAALYVERAAYAVQARDRSAALGLLAEARALNPDPAVRQRMASLDRDLKSQARDLYLERAALAVHTGGRAPALELLAAARTLDPDAAARRRIASLYAELKEFPQARSLLDGLIESSPADPGLRVERAACAAGSGDRPSALAFLGEARKLSPEAGDRRRMAYLHQELNDYAPALSLFDALVGEQPQDASLRGDRGLCRYLSGRTQDAIADLQAAIKLDPGLWPASVTLGAIYDAQGRHAQAAGVYDAALRAANGRPVELEKLRKALGR